MAEVVQSRPAASRGRPAGRAGRGGHSSRGTRSGTRQADAEPATAVPSLDEQGEIGQLKKQYLSQLETLKELFPDWTDDDLVFALQETDGDLQRTIERITEGNVSQFADVKKKTKEKSRAKKETPAALESLPASTRGRGRGGLEAGRGGRGRGIDRGGRGRGGRGAATSAANGSRAISSGISVPTTETTGWGDVPVNTSATVGGWDQPNAPATSSSGWDPLAAPVSIHEPPSTAVSEAQKSSLIPEGSKKSWASMLARPIAPPPIAAKAVTSSAIPKTLAAEDVTPQGYGIDDSNLALPVDTLVGAGEQNQLVELEQPQSLVPSGDSGSHLAPPKDQLTEDNLESLPDESLPAPTDTVASTRDPGSAVGPSTPYGSSQQTPGSRPPIGGYATTAWKATGTPARSASFQRKMMEQREAVVMPGNHAIDRATVQFGSMGLNGENRPLDIDDDREEAQTRTQPQQSPPSQPRTSLPPAPRQMSIPEQAGLQETMPTPKQAPGLPQPPSVSAASQFPLGSQNINQPSSQASQPYGQYGRFAGGALSQESGVPSQKQYDTFAQHINYPHSQQDTQGIYSSQSQASNPIQSTQGNIGGFSQGPSDYGNQFSSEQQRNAYQNYYGSSYGQQNPSTQQDQNMPPPRSGSGFAAADSGYGSSQANTSQARFGESQNSGHTTPNPAMVPQTRQGGQPMHQQPPGQTGHGGNYPYGTPYYGNSSYYNSYMNQYPSNYYNQQSFGAPFGGKGNVYGQPHHTYGMSPQTSYEQSTSPANAQGYGSSSLPGRDGAMSAGTGDYARSGSAQPSQTNTSSAGGYSGAVADGFGRGGSGYNQNQPYAQQQQQQQNEDALKPFNEGKAGPSPSLGQAGRANSSYGANQSNYPSQQSHQQGFGGYPSHLNQLHSNQGSQYGGLGGLGGHQGSAQGHQASGYGGYSNSFSGNNYGNYSRGGGWGGNYGH